MKKFTKSQLEVLKKAVRDIRLAKKYDYPEWMWRHNSFYDFRPERYSRWSNREDAKIAIEHTKKCWEEAVSENRCKNYWEAYRNQIVLSSCQSGTIRNLEKRGLIKIIKDSANERIGIDHIEILFPVIVN